MKVLMLASDVYLKGGIQRYTRGQYQALANSPRVESLTICSLTPKGEGAFEEDIEVAYTRRGTDFISSLVFVFKVVQIAANQKVNLVLLNHINLTPVGWVIKNLLGVPFITNVYGLEIWSGLNGLKKKALKKSQSLIGDCAHIIEYIREKGLFDGKISLLYDPVDIDSFRVLPESEIAYLYNKYRIPKDKLVVITVGRLERAKGHAPLISRLDNDKCKC